MAISVRLFLACNDQLTTRNHCQNENYINNNFFHCNNGHRQRWKVTRNARLRECYQIIPETRNYTPH